MILVLVEVVRSTKNVVARNKLTISELKPWIAAVFSGVALFASFFPLNWGEVAWFAFIPLTIALYFTCTVKRAMQLCYVAGAVFWSGSIFYVSNVTWFGYLLLAAYLAVYWIPYGVFVWWWFQSRSVTVRKINLVFMIIGSVMWVGSEYLRNTLFTGFPMSNLAVSQHENVGIIQVADLAGEYLISFLVMMMNLGIGVTILRYMVLDGKKKAWPHPEVLFAFALVALSFWYSVTRYGQVSGEEGRELVVSAVQPNIPQYVKWDDQFMDHIYRTVYKWTDVASANTNVNLIVWPETAIPHYLPERPAYSFVNEVVDKGVPLLAGVMDFRSEAHSPVPLFYNSSVLFDGSMESPQRYDKRHLVLMGEYVPLQRFFPRWLNKISPIPESFSAGEESTVFKLKDGTPFSVLICFEDMMPGLARESVRNGARMLVNQTNDGWFDPYWANRQRVAQCIFRCIENRVPAVRAANTGITCSIDRYGRVNIPLDPMIEGLATMIVHVPEETYQPTFYTRRGDLFGVATATCVVLFLIFVGWSGRLSRQREDSDSPVEQ